MELPLTPETEARLNQMAALRGCKPEELVEGLISDAADDMALVRETLDRRYDDMTSGKVQMIPAKEFWNRFDEKRAESLANRK